MLTNTVTMAMPAFVNTVPSTDRLYVKVETEDTADIGSYQLRPTITIYDTTGTCPNEQNVVTAFTILVFGIEPQPLED